MVAVAMGGRQAGKTYRVMRETYLKLRERFGVRESIFRTATLLKKEPSEVCDRLGFAQIYAIMTASASERLLNAIHYCARETEVPTVVRLHPRFYMQVLHSCQSLDYNPTAETLFGIKYKVDKSVVNDFEFADASSCMGASAVL